MAIYLDTGVWLKIYVWEARSELVTTYLERCSESIPLNSLQEFEGRNALLAKRFRSELNDAQLASVLAALESDFELGRWNRIACQWADVLVVANELAAQHTIAVGCRALDILHVAMAVNQGCAHFVTFDERQAKLAARANLRIMRLGADS